MEDGTSIDSIVEQLLSLGVKTGGLLLVHTAFSKVRPVESGPAGLIEALRLALGPGGTLVMPSMASDDDHVFDPRTTPCLDMGVVAETFWQQPGVLRSDSPHAFAAAGPLAARITTPHPVDPPHGLVSPVGRVYALDGQVLLLGVGHDSNTTIHLAENLAQVRYRRPSYATVLRNGRPERFDYQEIDCCCERFALADEWLDDSRAQWRGVVGHGEARLSRSRDIVRVVMERLRANETVFLHQQGMDAECDEAREGLLGDQEGAKPS